MPACPDSTVAPPDCTGGLLVVVVLDRLVALGRQLLVTARGELGEREVGLCLVERRLRLRLRGDRLGELPLGLGELLVEVWRRDADQKVALLDVRARCRRRRSAM